MTAQEFVQHVHQNPPRCISNLRPKPVTSCKPTHRLPLHLSVYHGEYAVVPDDVLGTASFLLNCPCGFSSAVLLGYYVSDETEDVGFVGPLSLDCARCHQITEFFDTRKHGYDGEQGVNTYLIGEGTPDRWACPHCGVISLIVCAKFSYQGVEDFCGEMRQRPQDFFGGFDLLGQCTNCNTVFEITNFECA